MPTEGRWPISKGLAPLTMHPFVPITCTALALCLPGVPSIGYQDPPTRGVPIHIPRLTKGQRERALADETNKKIIESKEQVYQREESGLLAKTGLIDSAAASELFTICDHNSNAWLSFSETANALHFTRPRFKAFDLDRDGRLAENEFLEYYRYLTLNKERIPAAMAIQKTSPPPRRSPIQLRNAYDTDLDGAVGSTELTRLLVDYGIDNSEVDGILRSLDADSNGALALNELDHLPTVLHPVTIGPALVTPDAPALTLAELFGQATSREHAGGSTPLPPLIKGPVPHFRRLDVDADGYISIDDLDLLLRPVRVSVQPYTVINTLDQDGDFKLSLREFQDAMGGSPKRKRVKADDSTASADTQAP